MLDIETVAAIAHEHELPLIVDNTFATPYLCRPIEWGADIVIHSATKFIGGHGTSIGGVVVDAGHVRLVQRPLPGRRRPVAGVPRAAVPRDVRHLRLPDEAARRDPARPRRGAAPFNAFLFLQGLETLSLRMERHVENALRVAAFLERTQLVANVSYGGLPDSRYRPLVEKYLPRGAGAVFSFDCAAGGRAARTSSAA